MFRNKKGAESPIGDMFYILLIVVVLLISFVVFSLNPAKNIVKDAYVKEVEFQKPQSSILNFLNFDFKGKNVYDLIVGYCENDENQKEILKASRETVWQDLHSLQISCDDGSKKKQLVVRPYLCDEYLTKTFENNPKPEVREFFYDEGKKFVLKSCYGWGFLKTVDGKIWVGGRRHRFVSGGTAVKGGSWAYYPDWDDDGDVFASVKDPGYFVDRGYSLIGPDEEIDVDDFLYKYKNWDFKNKLTLEVFRDE